MSASSDYAVAMVNRIIRPALIAAGWGDLDEGRVSDVVANLLHWTESSGLLAEPIGDNRDAEMHAEMVLCPAIDNYVAERGDGDDLAQAMDGAIDRLPTLAIIWETQPHPNGHGYVIWTHQANGAPVGHWSSQPARVLLDSAGTYIVQVSGTDGMWGELADACDPRTFWDLWDAELRP